MIILAYTGKHKGEGLRHWLGWALIRAGQIGRTYRKVTHTEILLDGQWHDAVIGSSSLIDGGVRIKRFVRLQPGNWRAFYLPNTKARNRSRAWVWFQQHQGAPYDWRGALGSVLYGLGHRAGAWFCNEACGAALGQTDPEKMPPAAFIGWLVDMGAIDVTEEFFSGYLHD